MDILQPPHIMVVLEDAGAERWGLLLTRLLREDGWAAELILGLEPAKVRLAWPPAPRALVLDVASASRPLQALLDEAAHLVLPPRLIVIAEDPVIAREIESIATAALSKPVDAEQLRRLLASGSLDSPMRPTVAH